MKRGTCRLRSFRLAPALILGLFACSGDSGPAAPDETPRATPAIRLIEVQANQGVGVRIFADGATVSGTARNAPLIDGRETLIWARWEVEVGWSPRVVRAELELTSPDGGVDTLSRNALVTSDPSTFEDRGRTFSWELTPEQALEGVAWRITLVVPPGGSIGGGSGGGEGGSGEATVEGPVPAEPAPVGFEESHQVIRVTLVPVAHAFEESCAEVPDLTPDDVATLGELLHRRNPTQRVVMTLREPFVWSESLSTYSGLLGALAELRFEDEADPAEYYAGLVHHCVRTGGQAITIPSYPTRENGWTRTVVSAWRGAAPLTSTTFVHEMGHAQGRRHVRCAGNEGGPDPNYPHPGGKIGVWGYNITLPDSLMPWLSGNTYHPTVANDYMGYCTGPQHVSDYGWRLVHPFIAEISSWELEEPPVTGAPPSPASGRRLLVATIDPDGSTHWAQLPGRPDDRSPLPGWFVEIEAAEGAWRIPAWTGPAPHGGRTVVAELPTGIGEIEAMRVRGGLARSLTERE